MFKRIVSLVLVVTLSSLTLASCFGDRASEQSKRAKNPSAPDEGAVAISNAGRLHNEMVDVFLARSGFTKGQPMSREQLKRAFLESANEVLVRNGLGAQIDRQDIDAAFDQFDALKAEGVWDFTSREPGDLATLINYSIRNGGLNEDEARAIRKLFSDVDNVGFSPLKQRRVHSLVSDIRNGGQSANIRPEVRAALDIAAHSYEYWTTHFASDLTRVGKKDDSPDVINWYIIALIAVDALAGIAVAWAGPVIILAVAALASIAFFVATNGGA